MSDVENPKRCSCCGHAFAELHVSKSAAPVGWLVRVECQQCGTQTRAYYAKTKKGAIEVAVTAWNRRELENMLRALLRQAVPVMRGAMLSRDQYKQLTADIDAALEDTCSTS